LQFSLREIGNLVEVFGRENIAAEPESTDTPLHHGAEKKKIRK